MSKHLVALAIVAFGCRPQAPDRGTGDDATLDASSPPHTVLMRRAIAVIVDFADTKLEQWQGSGLKSEFGLRQILDDMDAHWAFLSRGLERMKWDIVRVQLAQKATADAFADPRAYRDEVVRLAKEQIDPADYDLEHDGTIDTLFVVTSNNGLVLPFLDDTTSLNGDAECFGEAQDSASFAGGNYGNFNYEVARTLGLGDAAGTFGTLEELDLMANSWPVPANDFTAFERVKLGWLAPHVIDHTTPGIVLHDATKQLDAIRVPTSRPEEYFLIEYRKKPAWGFGSAISFDYDGLTVLHVFEASNQEIDPPLLKLEPADGAIVAGHSPEPKDLVFPGNPAAPLVVRTYFGGDPVFEITNVKKATGAMQFDLTILSDGTGTARDLMPYGTFEGGTDGWNPGGFAPEGALYSWGERGANGSQHSLTLASSVAGAAMEWRTAIVGYPWDRTYYVCGWLAGDSVTGGSGATLGIAGTSVRTSELHGTFDFTRRCTVARITDPSFGVACRLGVDTGAATALSMGQVWCDDVSLQILSSAF